MTEFSTIAFHSSHYIVFPWLVSVYAKAPSNLIKFPLKPHKISPVNVYCPQDVSYVRLVLIDLPLLNLGPHFPPVLWRCLPPGLAQGALPFVLQWVNISAPWDWARLMHSDSYSQASEVQEFALALGSGYSSWWCPPSSLQPPQAKVQFWEVQTGGKSPRPENPKQSGGMGHRIRIKNYRVTNWDNVEGGRGHLQLEVTQVLKPRGFWVLDMIAMWEDQGRSWRNSLN